MLLALCLGVLDVHGKTIQESMLELPMYVIGLMSSWLLPVKMRESIITMGQNLIIGKKLVLFAINHYHS